MRMDKLTSQFQAALADAQSLAVGKDHAHIEPAHVLVALLNQEHGTTFVIGTHDPRVMQHSKRHIEMLDGGIASDTVP